MKTNTRFDTAEVVPVLVLVCVLAGSLANPVLARDRTTAPEPRPSEATCLAEDHIQIGSATQIRPAITDEPLIDGALANPKADAKVVTKAGGIAVTLTDAEEITGSDIAVADNGDIYTLSCIESGDPIIEIYRSQDGGTTWNPWGTLDDTDGVWLNPRILVAEGSVSRCYVVATHIVVPSNQKQIHIAWADLSEPAPDFSASTAVVMNSTGVDFDRPRFLADDMVYSDFYIYVVAEGDEGLGTDIWFARSLDFGATWETPYTIATMNVADRHYLNPDIAYGQDGRLHVAWNFDLDSASGDAAIRTRSVPDFAVGGSAAWGTTLALTSAYNGIEEFKPRVGASLSSDQVVISERRAVDNGAYFTTYNPGVFVSEDAGATFTETITIGAAGGLYRVSDIELDVDAGEWIYAGSGSGGGNPAVVRAPVSDPATWSFKEEFHTLPDGVYLQHMDIALDPTHSDRIAAVWHTHIYPSGWWDRSETQFNAEWRGDPGNPVPEPGFPVDFPMPPVTDPCLADLDGDGDLEILCGYGYSNIGAWHHDGTPVDGWPVSVGGELAPLPIVAGDLTGDGQPVIVATRTNGFVVGYYPDGSQAWSPWCVHYDTPVYISIGALGGPEPRCIVGFQNQSLFFLDSTGRYPTGVSVSSYGYAGQASAPPAIGDVDGDGQAEVVFYLGNDVFARPMRGYSSTFIRALPADVSGAPILVDIDSDGDVEVVVPTVDGRVYLLGDDGSDFAPGWPADTGSGVALSSASVAACLPGSSYEFAFTGADNLIYLLEKSGTMADGFPITGDSASPLTPILAPLDGDGADLLYPDAAGHLHAKNWKATEIEGWPQPTSPGLVLSPSVGDIDQDGIIEAVWVTTDHLYVCDLGQSATDPWELWPMAHYDHQRTSCSNCEENLLTPVEDDFSATTISFAAPHPNPVTDRTVFSFTLLERESVELSMYDLRGRRVATLVQEQLASGPHTRSWAGLDDQGRTLASGHYMAILRVGDRSLNRKVTLLR